MKKTLVITCACLFSLSLFSQNLSVPTNWGIQKFSVSFGTEMDLIRNLDQSYMASTGRNIDQSAFSNAEFAPEDLYGGACENPHVRIMATLGVPGWKNMELNVGASLMFDRYDAVYYHNYNYNSEYGDEYLSYNSFHDEIALEASLLKRMNFLRVFNFYAGGGTNLGYSFGGEMTINGTTRQLADENLNRGSGDIVSGNYESGYVYETFVQRDGINQRLFGQLGFGIIFFRRLELALDYRAGIGYRAIFGAPVKMTELQSAGLSLKWIL